MSRLDLNGKNVEIYDFLFILEFHVTNMLRWEMSLKELKSIYKDYWCFYFKQHPVMRDND